MSLFDFIEKFSISSEEILVKFFKSLMEVEVDEKI